MKNTKGPWKIEVLADETQIEIQGNDSRNILSCLQGDFLDETDKANAALIASAPDLLTALEAVQTMWNELGYTEHEGDNEGPIAEMIMVRKAITKAKGE